MRRHDDLIQAEEDGYDGVLMLDAQGHVTEETRACFFIVRKGAVITPAVTNDILESISRETAIQLLHEEHGLEVQERKREGMSLTQLDSVHGFEWVIHTA